MPQGDNKHIPTDKQRSEVAALVSFGHTHEEIASYIDIDPKTLVKHYKREIDTALISANARVANRLFAKAVNDNDLSAQIFWLKTRARWRTTDKEVQALADENERVKSEVTALRAELAEKNKREY